MKGSSSFFYKIDYLTGPPSLYIFGKEKLQTPYGPFFSILVFAISFGFVIYFLVNFFQRNSMRVVYTKESTGFKNDNSLFMVALHGPFTEKQLNLTVLLHTGIVTKKKLKWSNAKNTKRSMNAFQISLMRSFLMIFFA